MKKAATRKPPSQSDDSEIDCSCELLDTSLSQVGDSDCSCSDCLEANLMAFNQLRLQEEEEIALEMQRHTRQGSTNRQSHTKTTQNIRSKSKQTNQRDTQPTKIELTRYQSVDRLKKTRPKTAGKSNQKEEGEREEENMEGSRQNFSKECVNDYVRITQYRARQYMDQLHSLKKGEEQYRSRLKEHIKQNLLNLKLATKSQFYRQKQQGEREEGQEEDKIIHTYKWNHAPYYCCRRKPGPKYLSPFDDPNRSLINQKVMEAKERVRQHKLNQKEEPYQCPDRCPNHHMRTSKKTIAKIEAFIKKKAKAYKKKKVQQKQEKEKKQKVKDAKLRAIDLKCKQIMARSKKYDPNISRTSFHNSIDHFSTFSQLGKYKKERDREREIKHKRRADPQRQARLEAAMYENIQLELIGSQPPIHSNIKARQQIEDISQVQPSQEWCEKIVRDAGIRPPRQVKEEDKPAKQAKAKKKAEQKEKQRVPGKPAQKQSSKAALERQQIRRRELQAEIQRRKEQIVGEFKKRSSEIDPKKSKNQALRMEYEKSLSKKRAY